MFSYAKAGHDVAITAAAVAHPKIRMARPAASLSRGRHDSRFGVEVKVEAT